MPLFYVHGHAFAESEALLERDDGAGVRVFQSFRLHTGLPSASFWDTSDPRSQQSCAASLPGAPLVPITADPRHVR